MRSGAAGGALVLALALAVAAPAGRAVQADVRLGYIGRDRVAALAAAAGVPAADRAPSPEALASFAALVDPVHLRFFLRASRPADLALAASLGRAVEATANPALTVEFVGVADDLSEPAALIAENGVKAAPTIVVYWMGEEIARMDPAPGGVIDKELASLITVARTQVALEMIGDDYFFRSVFHSDLLDLQCTRCHLAGRGSEAAVDPRR
jgi:hypothetical protein